MRKRARRRRESNRPKNAIPARIAPLHSESKVTRYAGAGIRLIDDLLPALAEESKHEAEEARKALQTAIDELKNRKRAS